MSDKLPKPYEKPCQFARGYTLDLYCDHHIPDDYTHNNAVCTFFGETFTDVSRQARLAGWKLHLKTFTATCPKCIRLLKGGGVEKPLSTMAEQAEKRPINYSSLSLAEQWAIDKELGILDWDGK